MAQGLYCKQAPMSSCAVMTLCPRVEPFSPLRRRGLRHHNELDFPAPPQETSFAGTT